MKKLSKIFFLTLISCLCANAQVSIEKALEDAKINDIIKTNDSAFLLVRIISGLEANISFERNVNIMRHQARIIKDLTKRLENETEDAKKEALRIKIRQEEDRFQANNQLMVNGYGFSVTRQYRPVYIKTVVSELLSDKEMSELKNDDGQDLNILKIFNKDGKNYHQLYEVNGIKENEELQTFLRAKLARKQDLEDLRNKLAATTDPQQQLDLIEKIKTAEQAFKQSDVSINERYKVPPNKSASIDAELTKLFLVLTPEELIKIEAQKTLEAQKK